MNFLYFLFLVWTHFFADFFADFVCQTDKMATQKSSSFKWLTIHASVYTIPFLIFGWQFALVNGVCHWITDAITSRITKRLWEAKEVHYFFVVIGLGQSIHLATLYLTQGLIQWQF
jgi:hypothetical protein